MKLKNLFLGALMTVIVAPAFAQDQKAEDQIFKQASEYIKSGNADGLKTLAKTCKKDINGTVSIGKAYLAANDLVNAQIYADKATEMVNDNRKATPAEKSNAYIFNGSVASAKNDAGGTTMWFEQAMNADPKNPEGYRLYATANSKSSPSLAISALEKLRVERPDYPVDLIAADIAANAGQKKKACEYYAKVKLTDMNPYQIGIYAFNLYMDQQTQKAADIAEQGTKIAPRSGTLNRLAFWANGDLKKYDKALYYADKLFNASDSVKVSADDYGRLATCYRGAGQFDKALEVLQKLADDQNMSKEDRLIALKQIAQTYSEKEDYDKAIPAYKKYMSEKEKPTLSDQMELGKMCMFAAQKETNPSKKTEDLKTADEMFAAIAASDANKELGLYYRAQVATMMDPDGKQGLAKPYYDQILTLPDAAKSHQLTAVRYFIDFYANKKGDIKAAVPYAEKWKALDPDNSAVADQVIQAAAGK